MRKQHSAASGAELPGILADPMPITAETILQAFEAIGLRTTPQRRLIAQELATLAGTGRSFTIQSFWQQLQPADSHIGYATVYRALHQHYLTCTQCHQVMAMRICLPREAFARVARETGFRLASHSIELFGRCPRCQRDERRVPQER